MGKGESVSGPAAGRWSRLSLQSRIIIPLLSFCVVLCAGVIVYSAAYSSRIIYGQVSQRAEMIAHSFNYSVEILGDSPELHRILSCLGGEEDVDLILIMDRKTRTIVASSKKTWKGLHVDALPPAGEALHPLVQLRAVAVGDKELAHLDKQAQRFSFTAPLILWRNALIGRGMDDCLNSLHST